MKQPDASALSSALFFASRKWRLIPLPPRSKVPTLKDWPNKATSDAAEITGWFDREPASNYGIVTAGFVVVDVDPRHGGHLWLEDNEHRMPHTWRFRTGSGGCHLIYCAPPGRHFVSRMSLCSIAGAMLARGDSSRHFSPGAVARP